MKFSVVIPVFNVEQYIEECIMSVLNQDYPQDRYEIVVVDDCTPDNSMAIVERLAKDHSNIRIIHHARNLHLGGARNTGIREAKGEWIFFLDSDDCWIRNDVLSVFESALAATSAPVVRSLLWVTLSATESFDTHYCKSGDASQTPTVYTAETREHFLSDKFFYQVWSSCYNRDFLINNDIFFRENIVFEDSDWTVKVFWHTQVIALFDFPFYGYRSNPLSITNKPRLKAFQDNVLSVISLYDFVMEVHPDEIFTKGIYRQIKKSVLSYIYISRNYPVRESKKTLLMLPDSLLSSIPLHVDATASERLRLSLVRYCPWLLCTIVKSLVNVKRFIKKYAKLI